MNPTPDSDGLDFIGDVHGAADLLEELLHRLGYAHNGTAFRHPRRQVVLLGDLIDRGPQQRRTLEIARAMHDAGTAHVLMGNHEFNAIAFATPDPERPAEFLRRHTDHNLRQHAQFLDEFSFGSADHASYLEWFASLPLWIDFGVVRAVHACWDPAMIGMLGDPVLGGERIAGAARKPPAYDSDDESRAAHPLHWAVEHLCKGPEVALPDGHTFSDYGGKVRRRARFRWWLGTDPNYVDHCEVIAGATPPLAADPIAAPPVSVYTDSIPVFFGHYWQLWETPTIGHRYACLDYSATQTRTLVAYRWSGEAVLDTKNFVAVDGGPVHDTESLTSVT
jgi:hypothetical protein